MEGPSIQLLIYSPGHRFIFRKLYYVGTYLNNMLVKTFCIYYLWIFELQKKNQKSCFYKLFDFRNY